MIKRIEHFRLIYLDNNVVKIVQISQIKTIIVTHFYNKLLSNEFYYLLINRLCYLLSTN